MRRVFVLVVVALAAGCAQPNPQPSVESVRAKVDADRAARQREMEKAMASWEGADINKLLGQWGPPSSTFVLPNGNTTYTYDNSLTLEGFRILCMKNIVADKSSGRIIAHSIRGCNL